MTELMNEFLEKPLSIVSLFLMFLLVSLCEYDHAQPVQSMPSSFEKKSSFLRLKCMHNDGENRPSYKLHNCLPDKTIKCQEMYICTLLLFLLLVFA